VVDAKKDAIPFYEKLGFMKLQTLDKKRYKDLTGMFIAIQTIEKALSPIGL
jgi:ribosomal protein S18 acetylase RimI-like enzyme